MQCLFSCQPTRVSLLPLESQTLPLDWRQRDTLMINMYRPGSNIIQLFTPVFLMFLIRQSICPWKPFLAQSNVCGKARSLPQSGTPEMCFTRVNSSLACRHQTRLERPARYKHSSLLRTIVNYGCKQFLKPQVLKPTLYRKFRVLLKVECFIILIYLPLTLNSLAFL